MIVNKIIFIHELCVVFIAGLVQYLLPIWFSLQFVTPFTEVFWLSHPSIAEISDILILELNPIEVVKRKKFTHDSAIEKLYHCCIIHHGRSGRQPSTEILQDQRGCLRKQCR